MRSSRIAAAVAALMFAGACTHEPGVDGSQQPTSSPEGIPTFETFEVPGDDLYVEWPETAVVVGDGNAAQVRAKTNFPPGTVVGDGYFNRAGRGWSSPDARPDATAISVTATNPSCFNPETPSTAGFTAFLTLTPDRQPAALQSLAGKQFESVDPKLVQTSVKGKPLLRASHYYPWPSDICPESGIDLP